MGKLMDRVISRYLLMLNHSYNKSYLNNKVEDRNYLVVPGFLVKGSRKRFQCNGLLFKNSTSETR